MSPELIAPALLFFLPWGFILLTSSSQPDSEAPTTASHLLLTWAVASLAYFAVGFAFQFGGIAQVATQSDLRGLYWEWYPLDSSADFEVARLWGIVAFQGWFLTGPASTPGALQLFLSHLPLVGLVAMLPYQAISSRVQAKSLLPVILGGLVGGLIYPITGNWVWGGGWLFHLGDSLQLGQGMMDVGGASLLFLTGSMVALAGYVTLPDLTPPPSQPDYPLSPPMPSAYLPILSLLGSGFMLIGWLGVSLGAHLPALSGNHSTPIAVSGLLAAMATLVTTALYSWLTTTEFNHLMAGRGMMAGLILVTAGAPIIPMWGIVLVSLILGFLFPPLLFILEHRLKLAEFAPLWAVYGLPAIVSLIMVSPSFAQLQAQLMGLVAVSAWAFGVSFGGFKLFAAINKKPSTS